MLFNGQFSLSEFLFLFCLNVKVDEETCIEPMFWLPEVLGQNVRCVLSLITDSEPHKALRKRKDFESEKVEIPVLDLDANKRLVGKGFLSEYSCGLYFCSVNDICTKNLIFRGVPLHSSMHYLNSSLVV